MLFQWIEKCRVAPHHLYHDSLTLTLFRWGEGGKPSPPTNFSPVTYINVELSPRKLSDF